MIIFILRKSISILDNGYIHIDAENVFDVTLGQPLSFIFASVHVIRVCHRIDVVSKCGCFCHAASVCMMCTFVFVTLPYYSTHCVKRKTQIDKKTRTENRAQIAENYGFRIIPVGKLLLESWIINVRSATNANGRQIVSRQTTRTSIRILGTIPIRILCILVVQLFRAYSLNKNCSTGVCTPHTG